MIIVDSLMRPQSSRSAVVVDLVLEVGNKLVIIHAWSSSLYPNTDVNKRVNEIVFGI